MVVCDGCRDAIEEERVQWVLEVEGSGAGYGIGMEKVVVVEAIARSGREEQEDKAGRGQSAGLRELERRMEARVKAILEEQRKGKSRCRRYDTRL